MPGTRSWLAPTINRRGQRHPAVVVALSAVILSAAEESLPLSEVNVAPASRRLFAVAVAFASAVAVPS